VAYVSSLSERVGRFRVASAARKKIRAEARRQRASF